VPSPLCPAVRVVAAATPSSPLSYSAAWNRIWLRRGYAEWRGLNPATPVTPDPRICFAITFRTAWRKPDYETDVARVAHWRPHYRPTEGCAMHDGSPTPVHTFFYPRGSTPAQGNTSMLGSNCCRMVWARIEFHRITIGTNTEDACLGNAHASRHLVPCHNDFAAGRSTRNRHPAGLSSRQLGACQQPPSGLWCCINRLIETCLSEEGLLRRPSTFPAAPAAADRTESTRSITPSTIPSLPRPVSVDARAGVAGGSLGIGRALS